MIETIKKKIFASEPFGRLEREVAALKAGNEQSVRGINGSLLAFVAAFLFERQRTQVAVVVPDNDRAERLRDDCALLAGEHRVRLFAQGSSHKAQSLDMTAPIAQVETLKALTNAEHVIVVTSAEALVSRVQPPGEFRKRTLELEREKEYPFESLLNTLTELGFERKDFVEEYGDIAVRGGILDVFPFVGDNPIRLEFWGDTVESIREFDVLSQRSIRELHSASIVANLSADSGTGSSSLFEYFQQDALLLVDEPALVQKEIEELFREGVQNIFDWNFIAGSAKRFPQIIQSTISAKGGCASGAYNLRQRRMRLWRRQSTISLDFLSAPQPPTNGSIKLLLQHVAKFSDDGVEVFLACDTREEAQRIEELIEEELTSPSVSESETLWPGLPIHLVGRDREKWDRSGDEFPHNDRNTGSDNSATRPAPPNTGNPKSPINYHLFTDTLHSGFIFPPAKLALLTEHEIFGRLKRRGLTRRKKFRGFSLKEAQQLRRGDYVVHVDYGIGRFSRLHKIKVRGVEQEVMKILYADDDVLYVNLNFANRVQKYSSQEGHVPKLTKLGAPDWERLKSRAHKRVKDIARELIQLYARRKNEQGFAFAPDTHWQKEMEASFLYEDTPDQATTTLDVKRDMESPCPMDRLVCGDVGFGKTEIAVRAAFKAVMSGKQVGVLVPTTILAEQHFHTFLDRLGRYSVQIESLSRFKSKKEQHMILTALKEGKVDVIIGTHRLLSKDIVFKDLGLLVIDEEHRFGVSAKEKLRQLRATVDTLTLTATPIPRTLQFSLLGARDLSIINTPPRNRLSIITEIGQSDLQLIREAILKELHRGGQVYFIHDRIHDIEETEAMLRNKIPDARFHIAHGQMKGHELEKAMLDFLEKKFDVLICTKIIESGIDIPSVNTIIVNRADRFGLAELYQLRGRVGRSNEQAYAFLLTPPFSSLPRATLHRLQAIQEFTELGSGFNLAMRDLEIRGAGNLLGAEQSGFIMEMGFEMYQKIVEEAVAELKEQEFEQMFEGKIASGSRRRADTIVEADVEALIPDFYIESDAERLDFYRRLYRVVSFEEIQSMREELKDRYGEYPEEVEHLFALVELKTTASRIGLTKVDLQKNHLTLFFPSSETKEFYEGANESAAPFQRIMSRISDLKRYRIHLRQEGKQLKLVATIGGDSLPNDRLRSVQLFLETLHKV